MFSSVCASATLKPVISPRLYVRPRGMALTAALTRVWKSASAIRPRALEELAATALSLQVVEPHGGMERVHGAGERDGIPG